jgi:hypothetical protein
MGQFEVDWWPIKYVDFRFDRIIDFRPAKGESHIIINDFIQNMPLTQQAYIRWCLPYGGLFVSHAEYERWHGLASVIKLNVSFMYNLTEYTAGTY